MGQSVPDKLREIISRILNQNNEFARRPDQIKDEHKLGDDLGLDVLDGLEIAMEIEDHWPIEVGVRFHAIDTFGGLVAYVESTVRQWQIQNKTEPANRE